MLNARKKSLPGFKDKSLDNMCLETDNQRFGTQKKVGAVEDCCRGLFFSLYNKGDFND